ncbi:MAG: hypothetical protein LBV19_05815 [Streptococcaceae bacterium]|jgi:competence protein ComGC|nr:hypothetical protein [Streptococcaceae bacterium]
MATKEEWQKDFESVHGRKPTLEEFSEARKAGFEKTTAEKEVLSAKTAEYKTSEKQNSKMYGFVGAVLVLIIIIIVLIVSISNASAKRAAEASYNNSVSISKSKFASNSESYSKSFSKNSASISLSRSKAEASSSTESSSSSTTSSSSTSKYGSVSALNLSSYTDTLTDSNGYRIAVSVKVGGWIKGTDDANLQAAWKAVGGTGEMPMKTGLYSEVSGNAIKDLNGYYTSRYDYSRAFNPTGAFSNDSYQNYYINQQTASYIFGNITLSNGSSGYPVKEFNNANNGGTNTIAYDLDISIGSSSFKYETAELTQYPDMSVLESDDTVTFNISNADENWTSGTVPFVYVVYSEYDPASPNGKLNTWDELTLTGSEIESNSSYSSSLDIELREVN